MGDDRDISLNAQYKLLGLHGGNPKQEAISILENPNYFDRLNAELDIISRYPNFKCRGNYRDLFTFNSQAYVNEFGAKPLWMRDFDSKGIQIVSEQSQYEKEGFAISRYLVPGMYLAERELFGYKDGAVFVERLYPAKYEPSTANQLLVEKFPAEQYVVSLQSDGNSKISIEMIDGEHREMKVGEEVELLNWYYNDIDLPYNLFLYAMSHPVPAVRDMKRLPYFSLEYDSIVESKQPYTLQKEDVGYRNIIEYKRLTTL